MVTVIIIWSRCGLKSPVKADFEPDWTIGIGIVKKKDMLDNALSQDLFLFS